MNITAVLMAGGESRRMGEDKATINFRGEPLWKIQLDCLRKLEPSQILISARTDPTWRPNGAEFVADESPAGGALSGLAAAFAKMRGTHLVVLAIDMPFMDGHYLRCLASMGAPGCGAVPRIGRRFEPLAASYPAEARDAFAFALSSRNFSLQALIPRLVEAVHVRVLAVEGSNTKLFRNLNMPDDLLAPDC
jgi:molybdopterin-guanine dinucleotide biosynthesis protein A